MDIIINLENLKQDECCICLDSYGCCNKNIHDICLLLLFLNNNKKCPRCIKDLEHISKFFDKKTIKKLYRKFKDSDKKSYKQRFKIILDNNYNLNHFIKPIVFILLLPLCIYIFILNLIHQKIKKIFKCLYMSYILACNHIEEFHLN